jgi:hypothetical protein
MKLYLQCIAGFLGPNKVLQIISTIINLLSFLSLALKFLTDKINKLDKTISEVLPGLEFFAYLFCFWDGCLLVAHVGLKLRILPP